MQQVSSDMPPDKGKQTETSAERESMISNLEYYRTFFAVGSFLSFTRAADYLCVSQPAVSQSIRRLEEELGCTLFIRSGKSMFFTAEGQELFRHVKTVMKELHSAEYYVSKLSALKT